MFISLVACILIWIASSTYFSAGLNLIILVILIFVFLGLWAMSIYNTLTQGRILSELFSLVLYIYNIIVLMIWQLYIDRPWWLGVIMLVYGFWLLASMVYVWENGDCTQLEVDIRKTWVALDEVASRPNLNTYLIYFFTYFNKVVTMYLYLAGVILLVYPSGWAWFSYVVVQIAFYYKAIMFCCSWSPALRKIARKTKFCCSVSKAAQALGASAITAGVANWAIHTAETNVLRDVARNSKSEDMAANLKAASDALKNNKQEHYRIKNAVEQVKDTVDAFTKSK